MKPRHFIAIGLTLPVFYALASGPILASTRHYSAEADFAEKLYQPLAQVAYSDGPLSGLIWWYWDFWNQRVHPPGWKDPQ
jgi:hypothetical protein